jgi:hypothetical protein
VARVWVARPVKGCGGQGAKVSMARQLGRLSVLCRDSSQSCMELAASLVWSQQLVLWRDGDVPEPLKRSWSAMPPPTRRMPAGTKGVTDVIDMTEMQRITINDR